MESKKSQFQGVFHPKKPVFGSLDARRVNDGIYTGPRGAYQRYSASPAAATVLTNPFGGEQNVS